MCVGVKFIVCVVVGTVHVEYDHVHACTFTVHTCTCTVHVVGYSITHY